MRLFFIFLFLLGIYFYGIEFLKILNEFLRKWSSHKEFTMSFVISSIAFSFLLKENSFLLIFEHEFTHMLWGLLFFKNPMIFFVNVIQGGAVAYDKDTNFVISLAPYFSHTFNFILIGVFYFLKPELYHTFFIVYGAALGYHFVSFFKEFSVDQPDIKNNGVVFSIIALLFANILSYGIVIAFVLNRGKGIIEFLNGGWQSFYKLMSFFIVKYLVL